MKKITLLFLLIGLVGLYSCNKDEEKVVLTNYSAAQLLTPSQGSSYILTEARKDSLMCTYTWSAAPYSPTDLVKPVYTLEMDTAGNNFASPKVLATSGDYSFGITEGSMNTLILSVYSGLPDVLSTFEFRVKSQLSGTGPACTQYSVVITLNITPYNTIVIVPPIYLLGSATTVGWDNTKALEMTHLEGGKFAIVEHLTPVTDPFIKFIANLGAWAPHWGTDASGAWDAGNLVLRPTESQPDPPAIPAPATEGDYYIMADTANLVYTVEATSAQLFLVGDATTAGWNNANGIPFDKVKPGIFSLTTTLTAGGMKFLEVSGQWAPQWGTDATGSANFGPLIYRPTESVPDPVNIPSPGVGTYTIELNLITKAYKISAK